MKRYYVFIVLCVFAAVAVVSLESCDMKSIRDVARLFPLTAEHIEKRTNLYIRQAKKAVKRILNLQGQRTFANTIKPLDNLLGVSDFAIFGNVVQVLEMVSPDQKVRDAAHAATISMKRMLVDILNNKALYQACVQYDPASEHLSAEQRYFFDETMKAFRKNGLELDDEKLMRVKELKKEIDELCVSFSAHIAQDNTTLTFLLQELEGVSQDTIDGLKVDEHGLYHVGIDYPTYFAVMQFCANAQTRKKLFLAFSNRAYPANEQVIRSIQEKRKELALVLGFSSYAQFDIVDQMAESPQRVEEFLQRLIGKAEAKEQQEFANLTQVLPESVELIDGKLAPWDRMFLLHWYKKKHFDLDEQEISEYFPVEKTVEGLIAIFESFFSLRFQEAPAGQFWSNDVRALQVYDARSDELVGYILLDLYPRAHKFSHACNSTIVPTVFSKNGTKNVGVTVIIANFPKAQAHKPALFKLDDVRTFFHEFGHALHGLLGRTSIATMSGYATKGDFVELPSQLLEEWLWDKDILTMVSEHYQTGDSLPEQMLDAILGTKHVDSGYYVLRQSFYALLSLYSFSEDAQNIYELQKQLSLDFLKHYVWVPEDHFFASFGHLTDYGAKYYGYLWSKVFALDLFEKIKDQGLLNSEAGSEYVSKILSRGGTVDPNQLLNDYLGRAPSERAFFRDMGL